MFDILFQYNLIRWDEDGVPIPLIEFVQTSEDSDDA